MVDLFKTGFFQRFPGAVEGAAVDRQNGDRGLGCFHNAADPAADSGQTKHLAMAVAGQVACSPVGQFADIGGAGAGKDRAWALTGTATATA